jgi:hypothetical protein
MCSPRRSRRLCPTRRCESDGALLSALIPVIQCSINDASSQRSKCTVTVILKIYMSNDPLDKSTSIEAELTPAGLNLNAKSRFVAAIDRLWGNIVDLGNIPIERPRSLKRRWRPITGLNGRQDSQLFCSLCPGGIEPSGFARWAAPVRLTRGKVVGFGWTALEWCPGAGSNHRHCDFQSHALPTELPGHVPARSRERRFIVRQDGCVHPASPAATLGVAQLRTNRQTIGK